MKRLAFYFIVLLQILFLIGVALSYSAVERWGETIRLKTAPVDPHDPFYGEYVTLNYDIEQLSESHWEGADPEQGSTVYVELQQEDEFWQVKRASGNTFEPREGAVILKGMLRHSDRNRGTYWVDYGMNRFYVEEGTGEQFEERQSPLIVEVGIAPWGQKRILSVETQE
ncbi:GDYXXLXY domain-containing protein [Thalassobacillus sp. CUG 92003]|uniref:GDYXXLXY domain-containing protein n=1 Tax=Thalassobacillus sp. CUG 92003 TaxID=2736641 RepID=UPI0015E7798B|nr:GDYXXLXY domain-containing protein [Thalassobacillus sp. CUG 92003]